MNNNIQRRDFFSLMPFLGTIPKPKLETEFDRFIKFLKTFNLSISSIEAKKLWENKESVHVLLFRLIIKQENIQIFYMTEDRITRILEPIAPIKRYTYFLNKTQSPTGYMFTIFDNGAIKGAIQFVRL